MILLQLALYCLLFVVLVKCAAGNSGLTKRAIATVLYLIIALATAGIVVLLGKL